MSIYLWYGNFLTLSDISLCLLCIRLPFFCLFIFYFTLIHQYMYPPTHSNPPAIAAAELARREAVIGVLREDKRSSDKVCVDS